MFTEIKGGFIQKMKLYSTALGAYDIIAGMDWLESHRALVDFYGKKVVYQDDMGRPIVIEGIQWEVDLGFISAKEVKNCIIKGCRIYAVEAISEHSNPSGKLHPILSEFGDVFPPNLPGLPQIREFYFSIPLKPGIEPPAFHFMPATTVLFNNL